VLSAVAPLLQSKASAWAGAGALARDASDKHAARFLSALAMSLEIQAEDCMRAAGYLIPERKRLDTLRQSGLLERVVERSFGPQGNDGLGTILDTIDDGLGNHTDTGPLEAAVCRQCGYLMVGEVPEACPNCGSRAITRM
jgi:rubrerythrin